MDKLQAEREQAVHLKRAGLSTKEVAEQLGRSPQWVRKWWRAFQAKGWSGLASRSHAPHKHGKRMPKEVHQAVKKARSTLEAEAASSTGLKYIGGIAIRTRLKEWQIEPLPSVRTIERILQEAKMTHPKLPKPKISYPHLRPKQPHEVCQVDHVPRYLQGGEQVYCFNAIDVVSRYPTGQVKGNRQAKTAVGFLVHVWQTIGIPTYTQVDNEACFIGGFTHPYVLGQCVRLALMVGTELVFSPVRHPQSNAYVERFHQDYQKHVWEDTYLADQSAVQTQAEHFFELYRHSRHHSALNGATPNERHKHPSQHLLPDDFTRPSGKLPLYAGRVHFMRRVDPDNTVSVLNVKWPLPKHDLSKGVWVTLDIKPQQATLSIYDQAPDVVDRQLLAMHPFPISEPVLSHDPLPEQPASQNSEKPSLLPVNTGEASGDFPSTSKKVPGLSVAIFVQAFLFRFKRCKRSTNETIY